MVKFVSTRKTTIKDGDFNNMMGWMHYNYVFDSFLILHWHHHDLPNGRDSTGFRNQLRETQVRECDREAVSQSTGPRSRIHRLIEYRYPIHEVRRMRSCITF